MTTKNDYSQQHVDRLVQLFHDGYITIHHGAWTLTEKGFVTLAACADRPVRRPHHDPKVPAKKDFWS